MIIIDRDFTLDKYDLLCRTISNSEYQTLTIKDYLSMDKKPKKFIIIRHDIDSEPNYALKFANLEKDKNIYSSYYFRHVEGVFYPELIKNISDMGHEIGYHYEVIDKALGNYELAIDIFKEELNEFRTICDIKTIAQHGSPLLGNITVYSFSSICKIINNIVQNKNVFTKGNNLDLWSKYDFANFGVIGEAYLSFDFSKIVYLSDSGRNWDPFKHKFRDRVNINSKLDIKNTNDLIDLIKSEQLDSIYLLVHPNQWKEHFGEWIKWLFFQHIRNTGKTLLMYKRRG